MRYECKNYKQVYHLFQLCKQYYSLDYEMRIGHLRIPLEKITKELCKKHTYKGRDNFSTVRGDLSHHDIIYLESLNED